MLQLPYGSNLHTTKKRLQLHNNTMRAYIEKSEIFYQSKSRKKTTIEIQVQGSPYTRHIPLTRPLPWTIEHDDEEYETINFIPYDSEEITEYIYDSGKIEGYEK